MSLDYLNSRSGPNQIKNEKLRTIADTANELGLPTWKLSRAAKLGLFPTYSVLNTRRLVKISEVIAAIETSRQGGAQ